MYVAAYPTQDRGEPRAYPRELGQGANQSQVTIIHTLRTFWKFQSSYDARHWTGRGGRIPEYPEEARRKRANSARRGGSQTPIPEALV